MKTRITLKEIAQLLDRSSNQLSAGSENELRKARQLALQRQHAPTSTWVDQHGLLHAHGSPHPHRMLNWLVAAIVAALLLGNIAYWYHTSEHGHGDIDIAILTDDMPIDVYVD